jgi:hypothetical protein
MDEEQERNEDGTTEGPETGGDETAGPGNVEVDEPTEPALNPEEDEKKVDSSS